uniref:Putative ovule protein n=1 Tax=Solanum chacoense TaxID=4108 RepID=A0A0V0H9H5_SOLCH
MTMIFCWLPIIINARVRSKKGELKPHIILTDCCFFDHLLISAPGVMLRIRMLQRRMPWEDSLLMVFFQRCILLEHFC